MAAKPDEDPQQVKGQIELLREFALGNFRDLLIAIAKDVAMLVWLDGRTNVRGRPQENFARELMELFTMGVGTFAEADVYAGARVFTGWNLARPSNAYYTFNYAAGQHDTTPRNSRSRSTPTAARSIPARARRRRHAGRHRSHQRRRAHPATGPRLARKLYAFFISEVDAPDEALIAELSRHLLRQRLRDEAGGRAPAALPQFSDPSNRYARYSWPAEFVARSLKEVGWAGFSVNDALTPMVNMGAAAVRAARRERLGAGAAAGSRAATMLTRMNFASQLATNQKFNLRDIVRGRQAVAGSARWR